MVISSLFFLIGVLLALAIRDFMYRAIELYYYILTAIAVILNLAIHVNIETVFFNFIMNTFLIIIITGCLLVYFKWKAGICLKGFFKTRLGLGDILFWVLTTPLFAPLNFLFWMILSLLLALIFYLLIHWVFKVKVNSSTIPLAGLQSVFLALLLPINQFVLHCNFFEEPLFFISPLI